MSGERKYKIRELTRKDRVTFTGLCKKLIEVTGDETIAKLFIADESTTKKEADSLTDESQIISIMVEILKQFISFVDCDAAEWFASLLNMSVEEYNDGPFDLDLIVIDQVAESESMASFFSLASGLFKKITESQKASKKVKTK